MTKEPIEAFPLTWPAGVKRTAYRQDAPFTQTVHSAHDGLLAELRRMGATNAVISSDVGPRKADGSLYARSKTNPADPGVAVYFDRKGNRMCFACDKYNGVHNNLHAVALTIGAIRGIERWGTAEMADAAFTGFMALPAPAPRLEWWQVLEVSPSAGEAEVEAAYRRLTLIHHPDRRAEIAGSLREGYVFPCHKTTDMEAIDRGGSGDVAGTQACAGAEILADRCGGGDKVAYAFAKALMGRDPDRFAPNPPIYATLEDFVADGAPKEGRR